MSILQKKIADIPEPGNYDKSNTKDDAEACGLDTVSFKVRNKDMFVNLMIDKKDNAVAVLCQRFEQALSKRELAFLLAKSTLMEHMKLEMENAKEVATNAKSENE